MTQRQEIIERLNGLEMEGGSHAMLSAICKAVLPHGDAWTLRRCADLRDRLVRLLGEVEQPKEQGESGEYSMDELLRMLRTATSHDSCHGKMPEEWCRKHHRCVDCHSALIDAISAASCDELQRAYGYGYDAGFASADDWLSQHEDAMAEHGWVRLPKDADGEYIHFGDELDVGFVERIVITDDEWPPYLYAYKETPYILTQHFCNEVSHYHAPTVEDVLTEFAAKLIERGELTNGAAQTIAEYAKRLQLREGDES